MAAQLDKYLLIEVRFQDDALSFASLVLRWLEARLVYLLHELESQCSSQPLLWPNRGVRAGDHSDPLYRVFYSMHFESYSEDVDSILNQYTTYLETQPIIRDNMHLVSVFIRTAERNETPFADHKHQGWLNAEAVSFTEAASFDKTNLAADEEHESCHAATPKTMQHADAASTFGPTPSLQSEGPDRGEKSWSLARPAGSDSKQACVAVKPGKKFRTEREVMSRIRYDPDFSVDDFLVGYEDRFTGIMEIPLSNWKVDTTEDEFIPLHRVVHFRRKATSEIVWDRRRRVDLIWG
ncbi:MAG: hypothetical protein Q9165_004196 [Trypethelium subeluteriae]